MQVQYMLITGYEQQLMKVFNYISRCQIDEFSFSYILIFV